jgi:large subunit ribosomal protein L30
MAKLEIKLLKSPYGRLPKHRGTLRALGLRKREQTVVHEDTAVIRGMVKQLEYALEVREIEE